MGMRLLDQVRDLSENTDDVLSAKQGHGAHFDGNPTTVDTNHVDACVGHARCADNLSREELARSTRVLRCDDGRELPPSDIADKLLGGGVHPTDDAGGIDDVARHVDVFEHVFDSHRLQRR